jgi:hypothetical protein
MLSTSDIETGFRMDRLKPASSELTPWHSIHAQFILAILLMVYMYICDLSSSQSSVSDSQVIAQLPLGR